MSPPVFWKGSFVQPRDTLAPGNSVRSPAPHFMKHGERSVRCDSSSMIVRRREASTV